MRYGSVCSGIEAATVAWHALGWRPAFFAEIEAFPSAVLAHHYPDVENVGDFTGLIHAAAPIPSIDVLVGGTPCQSFSVAGLRRGFADPRGGLTMEFLRVAQRLRPRWIVWENVPGVLSQDGGRAFGAFLGALGELGYGWAYRVLDAQYFGVAQRRRRVFVVGCAGGDFARAASVLLEPEGMRRDSPPRRATREGAAARAALGAGERSANGVICMAHGQGGAEVRLDGSPSLTCNHEAPIVFDTTQITSALNRSVPKPGDPCHPLAAGAHAPAVAFTGDGVTADPISAHEGSTYTHEGSTFRLHSCVQQTMAVRRLTPTECERLQGFPDDYTRISWKRKSASECPDGPRYKALGNSMAVPVMRWIGERITKLEAV